MPTYDRARLRRGVVHVSVGSFHRAHQAVYFDDLAGLGLGDGWALTGIGLHRRDMKEALTAQDGLYTVVERGDEGATARIVGSITRYLFAPEETGAVLAALADPATRLVTLTITGDGYGIDLQTGLPAGAERGSAVALLVDALDRRRRAGRPPFTVLSCDNLAANGAMARAAIVGWAAARDDRLASWIDRHVAFPASMVDRITPGTTVEDRRMVAREFGVRDRWPVITEPFSQWIVEDAFCAGRPRLDEVGVQYVADVRPYALMKTRLLNGSHCALGYLGTLAGHERLDQAMRDPALRAYVDGLMREEVAPLLPPVAVDLDAYVTSLQRRFASPAVSDPLARLCRNGSSKVPAHVLSSIREARALGRPHPRLTLAVAAWFEHLLHGRLEDPEGPRLRALARRGVHALVADERTFGPLSRGGAFAAELAATVRRLEVHGMRAPARGMEVT